MRRHTLFAYVDGYDVATVASSLDARFAEFVAGRAWLSGEARVVNQKEEKSQSSGDLRRWEIGMNLTLPNPGAEPDGWFSDVEEIAVFLRALSEEIGREFVVGISDAKTGIAEDLFFIDSGPLDIERLRDIIGIQEKSE